MKSSKKRIFSVILALSFGFSAFAVEWGGILKNDTKLALPNFANASLDQSDGIYLWLKASLGNSGLYLSGEGMYQFSYNTGSKAVTNLADLDLFKLSGSYELNKGVFSISAGRFLVSDVTSVVFAQNMDGLFVKYAANVFSISGYAGYTGFLNGLNVSMISEDISLFEASGKIYSLSNPFVPVNLSIEFPTLFGNQNLALQAGGYIDLGEAKKSRFYGTLMATGPITNTIFYNASTTFGSINFKNLMNYSSASIFYYPLDSFFTSVGLEYASGHQGVFAPFIGITSRPVVSSVTAPQTSGILLPKLSVNFVLDSLFISLNGKYLISFENGDTTSSGVEADLSVIYSVFSDLQLGLDITSYFDIAKVKDDSNFAATFKIAVSF